MGNARCIPLSPDRRFLPYQDAWIDDDSLLKLMEKGRQIGISWATADGCVERTAAAEARHDQWVSSRDEIQAVLFLEDCKKFARIYDEAAQDLGAVVIDPDKNITAKVLQFANTKRIYSMSSNPNAQAGKRGGRVLDEFALHPDPRLLYSIAEPGTTWGGQMEIISTHRGSDNFFNELVEEIKHRGNPKGFSLHTVTLQTALDQGFLYKLQEVLKKEDPRQAMDEQEYFSYVRARCASEEQFLQEYMCVPANDEGAFLTYDMIAACEYKGTEAWEMGDPRTIDGRLTACMPDGTPLGDLYLGVDVGRKKDLTVMWLLERIARLLLTRKVIEMQNKSFSEQEGVLYELLGLSNLRRAAIDATGLGMQFAERAAQRFGTYRVEQVRFTAPVKEALAYPVRAAYEDKMIRIPYRDNIRADLRAIKKTTTAAGNIRFDADSSENGHADRFWAQALAVSAASSTSSGLIDFYKEMYEEQQAANG
jgi:phage FluMu gp28-like protein